MLPAQFRNQKFTLIFYAILAGIVLLTGFLLYHHFHKRHERFYTIGIILSTFEMKPEDVETAKIIIGKKVEFVNQNGGINKRSVKAIFLDDEGDPEKLYEMVKQTSKDPNLIAYIGSKGSTRALKIAPLLAPKNIPFIGRYVLTHQMNQYPNAYSSEIDFKDLTLVIQQILLRKSRKVAFIGMQGDTYSQALLESLLQASERDKQFEVTVRRALPRDNQISSAEFASLADSIKNNAGFLVLMAEPRMFDHIFLNLWERGVNVPVYCGIAEMLQLQLKHKHYRSAELFDINAFGLPGVQNMRIYHHADKFPITFGPNINPEFQLEVSGRIVDEIGLIQEASQFNELPENTGIRERIVRGLKEYVNSNKIYRGWFADWSFTEDHGYATGALISWKPKNYTVALLAPFQYLKSDSADAFSPQLPVLYANLDLETISKQNDEEGTFYAAFYLDMNAAQNLTIDDLDFSNAVRNKINQEPLIEAKLIRSRRDSLPQPLYNYLYKISGKFLFNPELKNYPFDEQKFTIRLQPKNAFKPFLVQPPPENLRDSVFRSPGWIYRDSFVGYDQEIINVDNEFSSLQKNIRTYSFSYVFNMKRAKIDFTLKILVPLLALLTISYFSVYIPHKEFEAMCGIQVTALLAAIALYFSTYTPEMQYATISDKIFIFTYLMITSLIGTSIFLYLRFHQHGFFDRLVRLYQRIIFPLIVLIFVFIIRS